jgi:hypothetical protein
MYKSIKLSRCAVLAAGLLLSGLAGAAENTSIPFASMSGSIRDWQADGNQALYVQGIHKEWYRATLWTPCFDLPFAIAIGFKSDAMNRIDQFSSVIVEHERCQFKTFEKSGPPPPREKPKKAGDKDEKVKDGDEKVEATGIPTTHFSGNNLTRI